MTKEAIIAEAKKLPPAVQNEIADALWTSGSEDYELTEKQRSELRRRYEAYLKNPNEGSDWKTVRGRIEQSLTK